MSNLSRNKKSQQICRFQWCRILIYPKRIVVLNPKDGFPVFGKEKFLPEDLVWVKMSGAYKMLHINECVYIGDYLTDGLTKSGRRMKLHSPRGMMSRAWVYLEDPCVNINTILKLGVLYDLYIYAGDRRLMTERVKNRSHFLTVICALPGKILYNRWRKKYGE